MKYENEIREIIQKMLKSGVEQFSVSTHDGSLAWHNGEKLSLSAGTVVDICSEMVEAGIAEKRAVSALAVYYELTIRAREF